MTLPIAVLDMAGTTVADDGAVERAFLAAIAAVGVAADSPALPGMLDYVRATMGESKIVVFRHLLDHDEARAQQANQAFEKHYGEQVTAGGCRPIEGAVAAMQRLRDDGIRVALTTGFSSATQQLIVRTLGWHDLVDVVLAPEDAGRGRPYPDLPLTALLRLGGTDVRELVVVGDTTNDVRSGVRAGAGLVVGVLTGAHDATALTQAGATHVIGSVTALPGLISRHSFRAVHF